MANQQRYVLKFILQIGDFVYVQWWKNVCVAQGMCVIPLFHITCYWSVMLNHTNMLAEIRYHDDSRLMSRSGIDIQKYASHSVHSAATSKTKENLVHFVWKTSYRTGWWNVRTFARFYNKKVELGTYRMESFNNWLAFLPHYSIKNSFKIEQNSLSNKEFKELNKTWLSRCLIQFFE